MRFFIDSSHFLRRAFEIAFILKLLGHRRCRILRLGYNDMPWSLFQGFYTDPLRLEKNTFQAICGQKKPNILYGTASHALLVADFFEKTDIFYQFDAVLTRSEHLSNENRTYLEKIFKTKAYNIYASREFGPIGQECRLQNGFHINEDWVFVEILDENRAKTSEIGDIVITSLYNKSLPFIRYKIGDRGKFIGESCPCGLQTPRIVFEGRTADFISLPDGRRIPVMELYRLISKPSIRHFQIEQKSLRSLVIRLIAADGFSSSFPEIEKTIRGFFGVPPKDLLINVEKVDTLSLSKTGKWPVFISSNTNENQSTTSLSQKEN